MGFGVWGLGFAVLELGFVVLALKPRSPAPLTQPPHSHASLVQLWPSPGPAQPWPSLAQSSPASPSLAQPGPASAQPGSGHEVKANCFNFAWRNCFLLKPRSPAPKPRRRRREAPPRPTARKSLSAEGAIGGAFKARIKARVSKSTDIPCTLRGN